MTIRSTLLGLLLGLTSAGHVPSAHAHSGESVNEGSTSDAASRERSRAAFRKGVAQLRAEDWAGARASFEEAWSLVQHPSILLNLGIARLYTDDPVLAEQDLVRFLSEDSGATSEEVSSAREALARARSKIGTLRLSVTPTASRVVVDGNSVSVRAPAGAGEAGVAEVRLKAGPHAISIDADGFATAERSIVLPAKGATELAVVLVSTDGPKANAHRSTRRIVGWSLAGTAAVALATGGVMALRALSLSSDYETPSSGASFQDPDVRREGIALRTGADVALAFGLLSAAGAVVLLFTDLGAPSRPDVARPHALVRW